MLVWKKICRRLCLMKKVYRMSEWWGGDVELCSSRKRTKTILIHMIDEQGDTVTQTRGERAADRTRETIYNNGPRQILVFTYSKDLHRFVVTNLFRRSGGDPLYPTKRNKGPRAPPPNHIESDMIHLVSVVLDDVMAPRWISCSLLLDEVRRRGPRP